MASAFRKLIVHAIAFAISVMIVYPVALAAYGALFEDMVIEGVVQTQFQLSSVRVIGKTVAPWNVWDRCGPTGSALYRLRVTGLSPRSTEDRPIERLAVMTACLNGITIEGIDIADAIEV